MDEEGAVLGHFLRNSSIATSGSAASSTGLKFQHFRIVPILFPEGMEYHFDGLAGVVKVTGNGTHISWVLKAFQSSTFDDWEECIYLGTGTAKRAAEGSGGSGEGEKSREICFQNPGVNLLPIKGQLWLTIDTVAWGRIDPETLETVPHAHVGVASAVLNAHPACDDAVDECFVEHPCGLSPVADSVCVSHAILGTAPATGSEDSVCAIQLAVPRMTSRPVKQVRAARCTLQGAHHGCGRSEGQPA